MLDLLSTDLFWYLMSFFDLDDFYKFVKVGLFLNKKIKSNLLHVKGNAYWKKLCEKNEIQRENVKVYAFEFIRCKNNLCRIDLTAERICKNKENMFITGGAGTGKTHFLSYLKLRLENENKTFGVVAPTGTAALLVSGMTIQSFFGIGIDTIETKSLFALITFMSVVRKDVLQRLDTLIIDEISMLHPMLLITIDYILKVLRNQDTPFGGVQMIFIGDFFQLKPVDKIKSFEQKRKDTKTEKDSKSNNERPIMPHKKRKIEPDPRVKIFQKEIDKICEENKEKPNRFVYVFETNSWKSVINKSNSLVLNYIYRQKDKDFSMLLNQVREARCIDHCHKTLSSRFITNMVPRERNEILHDHINRAKEILFHDLDIKPTELMCTNIDVDKINEHHLNSDKTYPIRKINKFSFKAVGSECDTSITSVFERRDYTDLIKSISEQNKPLFLRRGAQVMLTQNLNVDLGLVNGSRGVVLGFKKRIVQIGNIEKEFIDPIVKFNNQRILRIVQSATFYGIFTYKEEEEGKKKKKKNLNPPITCYKEPVAFKKPKVYFEINESHPFEQILNKNTNEEEGNVKNDEDEDMDDSDVIHERKRFTKFLSQKNFQGTVFLQYPLKLAWCITIHKSQGMSIDKAILNLSNVFDESQAYVALSRVSSIEGLFLYPFDKSRIYVDKRVIKYYESLLR